MKLLKKMLYMINQTVNNGYDTYDSVVVCARSKKEARMIHPNGCSWDGKTTEYDTWCASKDVQVTYLGVAKRGVRLGIVLTSFNAG